MSPLGPHHSPCSPRGPRLPAPQKSPLHQLGWRRIWECGLHRVAGGNGGAGAPTVGVGDRSHASPLLQGYLSVLHLRAVVYVSLDNAVLGELGRTTARSPKLVQPLIPLPTPQTPAPWSLELSLPPCRG